MNIESTVITQRAYNKEVLGCKRFQRDVMVTFSTLDNNMGTRFNDFFLTQEQAVDLKNELEKVIQQNENKDA